MKVLVTGANGLLASNTIRGLIGEGYEVRGMLRSGADLRSLEGVECEYFYGNVLHKPDVDRAMQGCHLVVHAAADTSQNKKHFDDYFNVNVLATQYVISAALKNGVERLVFVSTANTMGYGTKEDPGTEDSPMRFPFTASGYAQSKARAEELVLAANGKGIFETIVVNPTFMIGPYDAKPSSGKILKMYVGKRIMAVPPGGKNFICVRDAAMGVVSALKKGRAGERYLLAGENLSFMEFFRKVDDVLGKKRLKLQVPGPVLRFSGTIVGRLRSGSSLNEINAEILCTGNYYSATKAMEELGLPQTPIEHGIAEALRWFGE
jgi:nucleoside-diphosphate-sugar epimerase